MMASAAGGMDIEEVAAKTPEKIVTGLHRARRRPRAVRGAAARLRASASTAPQVNKVVKLMTALYDAFVATDASLLEINPLVVTAERRSARARREDELRRQRALPPPRHPRPARPRRRGPARDRSVEVLAQLHPPRRQHRLHGQRRRPRDGDDGHHQAGGRRAGELPRRRRRRQRRADPQRVQDPDVGQEREGGADQHLRRHPALRRARAGRDRGGQGARRAGADRHPHGRHQRRGREAAARARAA